MLKARNHWVFLSNLISCCFFICYIVPASAELPLTIEDLISDKGQFRLESSLSYSNHDIRGVSTAKPITLQIDQNSFVTLPTQVSNAQGNSDILVATLGLRYGLTRDTEIHGRYSYLNSDTRLNDANGLDKTSVNRFVSSWLGLNHQFSYDGNTPALIGFIEVAAAEQHNIERSNGKSWAIGATTYRALDPIVLSLTVSYRLSNNRNDGDETQLNPGNTLLINPSVAFSVNDRITLTTGFHWINRQADRINREHQGIRRTQTNLALGLGYGLSEGSTINIAFNTESSGPGGVDLRLSWLYAF